LSVTIKTSLTGGLAAMPPTPENPEKTRFMSTMPDSSPSTSAPASADSALMREVAELVVSSLNLETAAADIQPDDPLYGDGLGLDSIDILEIALVVSKRYGLQLRADHEDNTVIFQSLRSLSNHIALQRTK
jgi:acyl carrier protein